MSAAQRTALVRDDEGGLVLRRFPAAVAAEHEAARDIPPEDAPEPAPSLMALAVQGLPSVLAHMRELGADRVIIRPREDGGVEIDTVCRKQLFVSKWELAQMLPKFSAESNAMRLVDALVELGLPYYDPTGSKIFCVADCMDWIKRHFAHGGRKPKEVRA